MNLSKLLAFFPLSTCCDDQDTLVKNIVIYLVVGVVLALIGSLLGKIALVGWIFSLVFYIFDLYCTLGIIFALLIFFNILKY